MLLSRVEVQGNMKENLKNLLRSREITMSVMTAQTVAAEESAIRTIHQQMDATIYNNPNDAQTRTLYDAVTAEPPKSTGISTQGRVYIAHVGKLAEFYYAAVVEKGTNNWYWWGKPASRPFVARRFMYAAQLIIKDNYFRGGKKARSIIIKEIRGMRQSATAGSFE